MNKIAAKIRDEFLKRYTTSPVLYFSPGRINLIGEHIDYNDGYVMPAAVDKGIYYAIAPNGTATMNFVAADLNDDLSISLQAVDKIKGWKNYVLGVVNEFRLLNKPIAGFDCVFGGDIPRGAGMSSSAAVEGGLAFALNELFNCGMSRVELALLCQRAEHNYPGVKCGIMDMYASLNGRKDHVLLLDCRNISHEYFPLRLSGYKIVLLNSKVHHSLASGEYNIRRQCCEEGLALMREKAGINSFREIEDVRTIEAFSTELRPVVLDCCRFVVEEIQRTKKAASYLQQNDLVAFGKLMFETHEGLSKLYKVSCDETDFLVEQAKANKAVIGSRQMGGGFGGCTINLVKEDAVKAFAERAALAYKEQFGIEPEAYVMETADGTNRLTG